MGISAARNILAKRGCKAAAPEAIASTSPPSASCHLEKINFRAIFNLKLYHPDFPVCSYSSPTETAQKKSALLIPDNSSPLEIIFSYTLDRKSTRLNSSHVRISYA